MHLVHAYAFYTYLCVCVYTHIFDTAYTHAKQASEPGFGPHCLVADKTRSQFLLTEKHIFSQPAIALPTVILLDPSSWL